MLYYQADRFTIQKNENSEATEKPTLLKWGTGKNFLTSTSESSSLFGKVSHSDQKVDDNEKEEKLEEKPEHKEDEDENNTENQEQEKKEEQEDIVFKVCSFMNILKSFRAKCPCSSWKERSTKVEGKAY